MHWHSIVSVFIGRLWRVLCFAIAKAIWSADAMDETTHAIFFKARFNERVKTSDSASVDIKGKSF